MRGWVQTPLCARMRFHPYFFRLYQFVLQSVTAWMLGRILTSHINTSPVISHNNCSSRTKMPSWCLHCNLDAPLNANSFGGCISLLLTGRLSISKIILSCTII